MMVNLRPRQIGVGPKKPPKDTHSDVMVSTPILKKTKQKKDWHIGLPTDNENVRLKHENTGAV